MQTEYEGGEDKDEEWPSLEVGAGPTFLGRGSSLVILHPKGGGVRGDTFS